jgi:uncharacterized protein YcbK (DUF882 family)
MAIKNAGGWRYQRLLHWNSRILQTDYLRDLMYRRGFLALTGGFLVAPRQTRAWPAPMPLRRLSLANAHTGETFDGPFRDDAGPITQAMDDLSEFLRDHYSGEKIAIDIGVLDFLASVMEAVGATRATVLSAYRSRETNAILARTTFGVAENSQHIYGRALDIRLPTRNEEAMTIARRLQHGGVGWYPHSGFFHIDTGPVRNWTLDQRGLDNLLFDQQLASRNKAGLLSDASRYRLVLPGLEQSGQPLPRLANSGRLLPGMEQSGRLLLGLAQSGKRLSSSFRRGRL